MNTIQDPTRKTSINSLLNPPSDSSVFPGHLATLPAANHNGQQHVHQSLGFGTPTTYQNGSYHLRTADWTQREANRKAEEATANGSLRHYHQQHHSAMPHPSGMQIDGYSQRIQGGRMDEAQSVASVRMEGQVWQPHVQQVSTATYSSSMNSDGPVVLPDGAQPQGVEYSRGFNNSASNRTPSDWQASERASLRLAARGIADPTQTSQQTPRPSYPMNDHPTNSYSVAQPIQSQGNRTNPALPPQMSAHPANSSSSKRQLPEDEAQSGTPKPKRSKAKPKTAKDGVPAPSKRGFNAKKRNEAAQIAAVQNGQIPPTVSLMVVPSEKGKEKAPGAPGSIAPGEPTVPLTGELQFARCMSNRYKNEDFPRCISCTRRWAGDTCRFQGIRYFLKDANKSIVGISFLEANKEDVPVMLFPTKWNIPLQQQHVDRTKKVIAKALLPTLKHERQHLGLPELIRRPRESDVRVTCDACMTSIFSSSWMCRLCGREACPDCFEVIKELTVPPPDADAATLADIQRKRERRSNADPFFLSCTRRTDHEAQHFSPMSRFFPDELNEAIAEMERVIANDDGSMTTASAPIVADSQQDTSPDGRPNSDDTATQASPSLAETDESPVELYKRLQKKASYLPPSLAPTEEAGPEYVPANITRSAASVPTLQAYRFTDNALSGPEGSSKFSKIWELGEPLVVANILNKFTIDWTPEYFMREFGDRECLITECEVDANKRVTIKEFFESFGKYDGRTEVWKLKDWPPSADFKSAFPKLYKDFSDAVPVPDYVRRDGVLNIGSHFPSNVIAPDLGPKMYNAWAANQNPGSKGSTRLHMDMADALNVMLFSSPCHDGSPGCAIWDIYRTDDSDTIRTFLRKKHSIAQPQDPIHGQQYYLDDNLRSELFAEYGVRGYRIYQRPGEAIFIPAGCAHQVSNMSDSIKIAIDYVSPENVDRCARLTKEFRELNKAKVWKEDVLQLKTMMWFAWLSCCKQEARLAQDSSPGGADPNVNSNN